MTRAIEREPGDAERGSPVTIAQIAGEAGVSVPTVSKVVNGRADVAPETRRLVEAIIRKHGYQRRNDHRAARSPVLELVFHELESAWAIAIIRGVEQAARDANMSVLLAELDGRRTPGRGWVEGVLARRPTGVISVLSGLSAGQRSQLETRGIPFVVVDPAGEPEPEVYSIGATNWSGGLSATRHLLELGHHRIAVIGGPPHVLCSRARIDGYRAALDTAGVPAVPHLVRHGDFHVEAGRERAAELLSLRDRPTAIFAGSDLQAVGVYQAARDAGLRIPEDLSVVGFDDLPVAQWVGPRLTTVRQPLQEMALAAGRLVLTLARSEQPDHRRIELATTLVVRESTAAPTR